MPGLSQVVETASFTNYVASTYPRFRNFKGRFSLGQSDAYASVNRTPSPPSTSLIGAPVHNDYSSVVKKDAGIDMGIQITGDITMISLAKKPGGAPTTILGNYQDSASPNGDHLWWNNNTLWFGSDGLTVDVTDLDPTKFYPVFCSIAGLVATVGCIVGGVVRSNSATLGSRNAAARNLRIGAVYASPFTAPNEQAEVGVWNVALSDAERLQYASVLSLRLKDVLNLG